MFLFLCAVSWCVASGSLLSCIHCTRNNDQQCDGSTRNCTGLGVCMSSITQTRTATGETTTTFERSCGDPDHCNVFGSMSSYSISTVTNNTCCAIDSCTPHVPTLPKYTQKAGNGVRCNTCFAHDVKNCSRFHSMECTGLETFCAEYEVKSDTGSTIIWGCSTESFCHTKQSQKLVNDKITTVSAKCVRSSANLKSYRPLPFLVTLIMRRILI